MQSVNNFNFNSISLDLSSIAFDIAEGSLTEMKEIFFIEGKYAPIVRWCSFPQSDWPKPHQILCEFWRNACAINDLTIDIIEADEKLSRIKPYLAILSKNGDDYHYEFFGDRYRDFHDLSDNPETILETLVQTQGAIPLLSYVALSASIIRGQGLLCLYQGGTEAKPELWNKLVLPLSDIKGEIKKFIICALRSPA